MRAMTSRDRDSALARVRGATVTEIVSKIGGEPQRASISVTLHLRSGLDLRGSILRIVRDDSGAMSLLVQPSGDGPERLDELTYLPLGAIEAVTVHAASEWLDIVSFGEFDRLPAEVPSLLAIQRRAKQIQEHLAALTSTALQIEVAFETAGEDETERYALCQSLEETASALEAIVERHGVAALARAVSVVDLAAGERPEVRRAAERLIVVSNLQDGPRGRHSGEAMISAIEAVL